ncbi:MAG: energy transducer TonB [Bacteroidota bacterium]|nr:energy transducer TonB [Bacteroidota bacterium]
MKRSILLLSGVIIILSFFQTLDTKLKLWETPSVPNQYYTPDVNVKIKSDREFFIFDLFINFFSSIDIFGNERDQAVKDVSADLLQVKSEIQDNNNIVSSDINNEVVKDVIEKVQEIEKVHTEPKPPPVREIIEKEVVQKEEPKIEIVDWDQVFLAVKEMPEFNGGNMALQQYIQNNTNYPDIAKRMDLQGYVYVNYVVDQSGNITDVNLKKGVHQVLDDEALRVVGSLPRYKNPGKKDGIPVKVQLTIPVNFAYKSGNPVFDAWWESLSVEEKQVFNEEDPGLPEEKLNVESIIDNGQESMIVESIQNQPQATSIEDQINLIKEFPAKGAIIGLMIRYLKSGELTFDDLCSIRDSREGKSIKRKHLKKMIKTKNKKDK